MQGAPLTSMINIGLLKNTRNSQKSKGIEYRQESNSDKAQVIILAVPESEKRVMILETAEDTSETQRGRRERFDLFRDRSKE